MSVCHVSAIFSENICFYEHIIRSPEVFDILPMAIYWKGIDGRYIGRNIFSAQQMVFENHEPYLNRSRVFNKTDFDLFDKKTAELFRQNDLLVLDEPFKIFHFFEETQLPSGGMYENISIKRAILSENNDPVGIFGCSININKLSKPNMPLEKILKEKVIANVYKQIILLMSKEADLCSISNIATTLDYLAQLCSENVMLKKILLLTPREFDCLCLLLKGFSAKKIGLFLNISYRTIEIHINHIKEKLNLTHKNEIVSWFWGVLTDFSR